MIEERHAWWAVRLRQAQRDLGNRGDVHDALEQCFDHIEQLEEECDFLNEQIETLDARIYGPGGLIHLDDPDDHVCTLRSAARSLVATLRTRWHAWLILHDFELSQTPSSPAPRNSMPSPMPKAPPPRPLRRHPRLRRHLHRPARLT